MVKENRAGCSQPTGSRDTKELEGQEYFRPHWKLTQTGGHYTTLSYRMVNKNKHINTVAGARVGAVGEREAQGFPEISISPHHNKVI